jgi:putative DNA primase/helicase
MPDEHERITAGGNVILDGDKPVPGDYCYREPQPSVDRPEPAPDNVVYLQSDDADWSAELDEDAKAALSRLKAALVAAGDRAPLVFATELHKLLAAIYWRLMPADERQAVQDHIFIFASNHDYLGLPNGEDGVRAIWMAAIAKVESRPDREVLTNGAPGEIPHQWPDPHPLPEGLLPVDPFRFELLPEGLRPWVNDVSERMQCAPDFVAVGVMAALGSIIGRKVAIRPMAQDDWTVVGNQWALCIGRPGVLKSPAMEEALRPLKRLSAKAEEVYRQACSTHALDEKLAELQTGEALKRAREHLKRTKKKISKQQSKDDDVADEVERDVDADTAIARARHELEVRDLKFDNGPTLKRYIVNDTNVASLGVLHQQNPNGLLVFRDELVSLLDSLGQEDKVSEHGFYLTAWNGDSSYTFDRIGRGLHMHIPGLCLSMLGGTQPGKIADYVRRAVRGGRGDDGLIQRFGLSVWPDNSGSWRHVDRWPETAARKVALAIFERLDVLDWKAIGAIRDRGDGGDEEGLPYLRFGLEAYDHFVSWRADLERGLRSGDLHPALESHLAKYRKLVPGLALIGCVADDGARHVDAASLDRAIAWAKYLESHARRIYGSVTVAQTDTARAIVAKIKSGELKNGFGSRDVWRPGWSKLSDRDTVTAALGILVEYDWLARRKVQTTGRPSLVYTVNPKILRA